LNWTELNPVWFDRREHFGVIMNRHSNHRYLLEHVNGNHLLKKAAAPWSYLFTYFSYLRMGVQLGLWHQGKNKDWGCLRTGRWGEYLDRRGMQ
jgi:hypothetical protein